MPLFVVASLLLSRPAITLPDLSGKTVQVLPSKAKHGVVAFFVLSDCPNANAYAPEIKRIAKAYAPQGWATYLVYADASASPSALKRHASEYGYEFPLLHGRGELMLIARVTKSPEVAVFSASGNLEYHGRIDDRFYALGKQRPQPRSHDLREVLDAIDSGKRPSRASTEVVGCFLPRN